MQNYRLIDESGFFIEDVINPQIEEGQEQFYIEEPVPQGFYHPKWNGSEWIEGLSQEQIDELKNQLVEPTEIEKLRLETAQANAEMFEMMLSMMMGGGL